MSSEPGTPCDSAEIEKWIAEARGGSREALGRLLDLCRRYLLLAANQELTPVVRAKVAPSDIVQDTLLEAGRDFPGFHGATEAELLGWLRRMLRHNVANVHRHFTAEKRQVEREVSLAGGETASTDTPSRRAMAREQDEQLDRAVRQLPEHYRQVLFLHTSENLTFAQIAEKLGNTPDGVRKLWARAVDKLAQLLDASNEST